MKAPTAEDLADITEASEALASLLSRASDRDDAQTRLTAFFGVIANNISEEDWQLLRVPPSPCGCPGCDCHIQTQAVITLIDDIRDAIERNTSA